jgi:hypothetical protein
MSRYQIYASLDVCDPASSAIHPNIRKTIKYNSGRAIQWSCRSQATEHGESTRSDSCDTIFGTHRLAARRAGVAATGRLRAGTALVPRGEFNIVIAGLAVTAGTDSRLGPLAAAYVLILAIAGPLLARTAEPFARIVRGRHTALRSR